MKPMFKRMLSGMLSAVMAISAVPIVSAHADESTEPYPYTLFAASSDDGAITVNAGNLCINGSIATNGTIVSSGNMNVNGTRAENADESMIFIFDKIDNQYFSSSNVDEHDEDYTLDELNININVPTTVQGETNLTGNININNALKALEDVKLYGEVKNTNDSVIFSKYGDIIIDSQNVNLNGLVYAPFGSVTINAQNLNLNNVVIIAESIVLTCPNVNANNSNNVSSFVGTASEPLNIPYDEWQYMKDENENDFPDFFENPDNLGLLNDTDGDRLPDCVEQFIGTDATLVDTDDDMLNDYYEVFVTCTDPALPDTDNNGVADGNEDFDTDSLTNYQEYIQGTSPWNSDSDSDDLSDGDEVNIYSTNPLEPDTDNDGLSDSDEIVLGTNPNLPDTDGDGTPDGEERFDQTFVYDVENKDCAIEQVIVSMECVGNLQKSTSIETVMGKDLICTDVVGLVGEPFSIKTTPEFEKATLEFIINPNLVSDDTFNNLLFLWYDEENDNFVEIETIHDLDNHSVKITTNHFSKYMLVDQSEWFEAWKNAPDYFNSGEYKPYNTVICMDCSGSMSKNDPDFTYYYTPNHQSSASRKVNYRTLAIEHYIDAMKNGDKTAIVNFEGSADKKCDLTSNKSTLRTALSPYNGGSTNAHAAVTTAIELLNAENSKSNKTIILLSDGDVNITPEDISDAKSAKIKIYTVGLGAGIDSDALDKIATDTGAYFYNAKTAEELEKIYSDISYDQFKNINWIDNDEDGIPDDFEASGLICSNGKIYYTEYEDKNKGHDTDDDGLSDGEEIIVKFGYKAIPDFIGPVPFNNLKLYFQYSSNPIITDTDEDGIGDFSDCYPTDPEASLDDDELYGIYQYFLDLESENMSNRPYQNTPEDWENELYNNIYETISMIPDDLTQSERTIIIDSVVIIEANSLQEKYKTVYYASDNFINKYITQPGFHDSLVPLYTQYPVKNKNTNKYLKAFWDGFSCGFKQGLLFAVTDTIASYEYNDSMAYARNVGKAGEIASGITKNTRHIESITKTAQYRIPDGLDEANMVLSEVKNVKYQGLTSQIKDFLYYSQREGYRFELYVRPTTTLSKPLQDLVDAGEIIIKYLP